jgi:hypothetical protein
MSDRVRRGGVHRVQPVAREFLVISIDTLNDSGTAIVVEVGDARAWSDYRNLLVVPFGGSDRCALAWRVNYMRADRLGRPIDTVDADTLARVVAALTAAVEP